MILVVDNYDSFTYNLVQMLGAQGAEVRVVRNDQITVPEVAASGATAVLLSPGPGNPDEAGITLDVLAQLHGKVPLFGVCLGHQCIGQAFGGTVVRAPELVHGKTSEIHHDGKGLFADLPNPFTATRYHSLMVRREDLPECLEVSAWTDDHIIMGLRHRTLPIEGVQFHPESILTEEGPRLLRNFLEWKP